MLVELLVFAAVVAVVAVLGGWLGMLVARWIDRRSDADEEPRVDD
jgi:hypothetical protein